MFLLLIPIIALVRNCDVGILMLLLLSLNFFRITRVLLESFRYRCDGFLSWCLLSRMVSGGVELQDCPVSSQCKLGTQNLRSLTIYEGSSLLKEPLCLPTLEKLITRSSDISQVPTWVSSLRNLQLLRLTAKGIKKSDLCILWSLTCFAHFASGGSNTVK